MPRKVGFVGALVVVAVAFYLAGYFIPHPVPAVPKSTYPTTSLNLTYGQVDDSPLPDLVAVTTDDGVDGYAFSLQLLGRPGSTAVPSRQIPVYDLDLLKMIGYTTVH